MPANARWGGRVVQRHYSQTGHKHPGKFVYLGGAITASQDLVVELARRTRGHGRDDRNIWPTWVCVPLFQKTDVGKIPAKAKH